MAKENYTTKQLDKINTVVVSIDWIKERIDELKESIEDNKQSMEDAQDDANGVIGGNQFDFSSGRPDTSDLERAIEDIEYAWDEYENNKIDMEANQNEISERRKALAKETEKLKSLKGKYNGKK